MWGIAEEIVKVMNAFAYIFINMLILVFYKKKSYYYFKLLYEIKEKITEKVIIVINFLIS